MQLKSLLSGWALRSLSSWGLLCTVQPFEKWRPSLSIHSPESDIVQKIQSFNKELLNTGQHWADISQA